MKHWQIFLDFDSTLVRVETLDLLAHRKGIGPEVERITRATMDGNMKMEDGFLRKVALIAPHTNEISAIAQELPSLLLADAEEVVGTLHAQGHELWILTGNFHQLVDPLARQLGIPPTRILANDLQFHPDGSYQGVVPSALCQSDGKVIAIKPYLNGAPSIMVGDSAGDMACKEVVDMFVGFGGVVCRPIVKKNADMFIETESLKPLLAIISSAQFF